MEKLYSIDDVADMLGLKDRYSLMAKMGKIGGCLRKIGQRDGTGEWCLTKGQVEVLKDYPRGSKLPEHIIKKLMPKDETEPELGLKVQADGKVEVFPMVQSTPVEFVNLAIRPGTKVPGYDALRRAAYALIRMGEDNETVADFLLKLEVK